MPDAIDRLAVALDARDAIEQIECDGVAPDLKKLVALARQKGHCGFIVIDQGGNKTPFVGAFLGRDGRPKENTWASHATPEAALVALGG